MNEILQSHNTTGLITFTKFSRYHLILPCFWRITILLITDFSIVSNKTYLAEDFSNGIIVSKVAQIQEAR